MIEVMRETLPMPKRVEDRRELRLERLRRAIREGDEAAARGDVTEIGTDAELDAFFAGLRARHS